ncbi:MAG: YbaK/EbsC family protein [Paracoccaceae bacterium]|jgi:prolyl-tRNA editing enzyme YbaK/EbsC (Cys-tRNA(Pro) deacylase)
MSKSVKRVEAVLSLAGLTARTMEMTADTRTAELAAAAANCQLDQIAKSIIFQAEGIGEIVLFITAGGNRVAPAKASLVAGLSLGKADADVVRSTTGFAIGGVAPIGHLNPIRAWFDPRLLDFDVIWAAAGTPRHIFPIDPHTLLALSGATIANFTE